IRGDTGAGGDQQVAGVVVAGLQAEATVRAAGADMPAGLQPLEQRGSRPAGDEADRDLHRLARRLRMRVDGGQRIAALGRGAVGTGEMDLDELARLEIQRLPVITDELVMTDRRREHAPADQLEGELDRHEEGTVCSRAGAAGPSIIPA